MAKTKGTKEWAVRNVNFSKGCSNGCLYCYARANGNRFGWKKWDDWQNMENKYEMQDKKFKKVDGWIMSPSSHDITMTNIRLAVEVFRNILEPGNKLIIVTKPDENWIRFLLRNLWMYAEQIIFRFTITTLDDSSRFFWEPEAPNIHSRIECLKLAFDLGFRTSVSIEPFLDDTVVNLVNSINYYVSEDIWIGPMNMTHVPAKYKADFHEELNKLYSKENLLEIKKRIDSLDLFCEIKYKDHFLNKIKLEVIERR